MTKNRLIGFSPLEFGWVAITLLVIASATFVNLKISLRRSRDAQRKDDIRSIANAVENFKNTYAYYPPSDAGKLVACGEPQVQGDFLIFETCKWGWDTLGDRKIPADPHTSMGASYIYTSDGTSYSLYASLEGKDETEYDLTVEQKNLQCGNRICNFIIHSDQ